MMDLYPDGYDPDVNVDYSWWYESYDDRDEREFSFWRDDFDLFLHCVKTDGKKIAINGDLLDVVDNES